ncbi:hypothetical protein V1524DRAFT_428835 [Lipomyces starkeyi]
MLLLAKCQNFIWCLVCCGTNAVSGCLMSVADNNLGILIAGQRKKCCRDVATDWCADCRLTCQRSLTLPLFRF